MQAHHGLVDGVHVARLLEHLSALCRQPAEAWGGADGHGSAVQPVVFDGSRTAGQQVPWLDGTMGLG